MDDTLRLWDSLFSADAHGTVTNTSQPRRFQYIDFVAVALIQNVGTLIKQRNDFADIMELLQKAASLKKIGSIDKLL